MNDAFVDLERWVLCSHLPKTSPCQLGFRRQETSRSAPAVDVGDARLETFDGELHYADACWSNQLHVISIHVTVELISVSNVVQVLGVNGKL